jgi:hypothetical protein
LEKLAGTMKERPANGGLLQSGGQSPRSRFHGMTANSPKVSGHDEENSRFRETDAGVPV